MSKWNGRCDARGCAASAVHHGPQFSVCAVHLEPAPRDDITSGNVWPDDAGEELGVTRADWEQELAYARAQHARRTRAAGDQPAACITCGTELDAVEQWAGDVECKAHRAGT